MNVIKAGNLTHFNITNFWIDPKYRYLGLSQIGPKSFLDFIRVPIYYSEGRNYKLWLLL